MSQNELRQPDQDLAETLRWLGRQSRPRLPEAARERIRRRLQPVANPPALAARAAWGRRPLLAAGLASLALAGALAASPGVSQAVQAMFGSAIIIGEMPGEWPTVTGTPQMIVSTETVVSPESIQDGVGFEVRFPAALPAGLELIETKRFDNTLEGVGVDLWYRGQGRHLTIRQSRPEGGIRTYVPPEQVVRSAPVDGHVAVIYDTGNPAEQVLVLEWTDGERIVTMFSNLSADELIAVLESLP